MKILNKYETLIVAATMSSLTYTTHYIASEELANMLGVDQVEYNKPVTGHYIDLHIHEGDCCRYFIDSIILKKYGQWNEVLVDLVLRAMNEKNMEWKRNEGLSALLGYSKSSHDGVYFHVKENMETEFIIQQGLFEVTSFYTPAQFILLHLYPDWSE